MIYLGDKAIGALRIGDKNASVFHGNTPVVPFNRCVVIDASTVQPYEMTNLRIEITPGQYMVDNVPYYNIFEYSYDGYTWNRISDSGGIIDLGSYKKVYMRGICGYNQYETPPRIRITADSINLDRGSVAIYGNFNSLLRYTASDINNIENIAVGKGLFMDSNALTIADNLLMPQMDLDYMCYKQLFDGCTSLTTAPELPATTLANGCYFGMFNGCTSLTTAPELPATTLDGNCYSNMFNGCTSLTTAPELPATTLGGNCYGGMFQGCTALTIAPELPATTLDSDCYSNMFNGCTSLTTAPELPATTLALFMCYANMFQGCTNLHNITCLATYIPHPNCTEAWTLNLPSTGTFVKHPDMNDWATGEDGIPSGWTVVDADI